MRVNEKMRKALSILLCLCMLLQNAPVMAFAATTDNLCDHHTEHTPECGYAEAVAGSDCTHIHDGSCGYAEPVAEVLCACEATDENGALVHTEGCGYVAPVAGADCTHVHDEACGYATAVEAHECHYECAECANNELSSRTSPQTGVAIPEGDAQNQEIATSAPDGDLLAMTEAVCDCGTDDPAIHATTCAVYVAPENPVCYCAEKCTEPNIWCDVCGFDVTGCTGTDTAALYETTWTLTDGTLTISGTGAMENWSSFSSNRAPWYNDRTSINKIVIGSGVTSVGDYAFNGCSNLTSVNIPNSVTSIGYGAFINCSSLASVTIPGSVTSINNFAFDGCSGLTSVTIGNSVTSIGAGAFDGCSGLTSVNIPDSVTSIGKFAFRDCSGLTSVTIGNSVTSIDEYAFKGCSSLKSVVIPDSVTSIGYEAFYGCSGLTSVTIGNSVTSIGRYAFEGCSSLASVVIPDSVTSIGTSAFEDCSGLTSVTIGNSVTSIGNYAFDDCSNLASVVIPDSVTSIGNYAFYYCKNLTSVTIGNSVESIGEYAFKDCSSLESVTIGNSVTSIGYAAFAYCRALTSVVIPDSVTSIGNYAFNGCSGLTSVEIGNSVTSIGNSAFYDCSSLESVTIGNSVTSIGEYAFDSCTKLTSVTAPCKCTVDGQSLYDGETLLYTFGDGVEITIAEHKASDTGAATCIKQAVCGTCGASYGEVDTTNHDSSVECVNGFCPNGCYEPAVLNGDVYEISNAGQLYWFAAKVNAGETGINGKLTKDITVNEGTMTAETTGAREWTTIGYWESDSDYVYYTGSFDGGEHTISGLYFNDSTVRFVGLFGRVGEGGEVQNVGVVNSYFCGDYAGGVAGYNEGTVTNCYNTGTVTGGMAGGVVGGNVGTVTNCYNTGTVSGDSFVGGVVGSNDGTVRDCHNTGNVSGNRVAGGVVGDNWTTVTNCYNTGDISGNDAGGMAGFNDGTVTNCYNTGDISGDYAGGVAGEGTVTNCYYLDTCGAAGEGTAKTAEQFASGEVAYLLNGSASEGVWKQTLGTDAAPNFTGGTVYSVKNCKDAPDYSNTNETLGHKWVNGTCSVCGEVCPGHTGGEGTCNEQAVCTICGASYYEVNAHSTGADGDKPATCKDKAYCSVCESYYGEVDTTNHDSSVAYDSNGFCENGCYEPAVLNNGVYEISNAGQLYWFAARINGGEADLDGKLMQDIVVNPGTFAADGTYTPKNGETARVWTPIGYFVSYDDQFLYNGTFDGQNHIVSGLYFNDSETDCVGLFGNVDTGGILKNVGVVNSYLRGRNYVGGVAGYNDSATENCYNTGYVSGNSYVGGVLGQNSGTATNCYNTGSVYGNDECIGGVVGDGYNDSVMTNCYNTGSVSGESYVGGVAGYAGGTVTDCYNTGTVSGSKRVGGVAGYAAGTVTDCYNTGDVSGSERVGGVVGHSSTGTVSNCYNTGDVTGGVNVGGVVGQVYSTDGTVTNCYNTGNVSGTENVGGVVGQIYRGTVSNCYNTGNVSGTENVGGTVGSVSFGSYSNLYYLDTVASGAINGADREGQAEARTAEQFASGEVAYLLNGSTSEGELVWKQTLGTDAAPNFTGGTVYSVKNCKGEPDYFNTNETLGHKWVNGTCSVCGEPCGHTGGTATCTEQAVCDICGESYGELAAHSTSADGDKPATCKDKAYCSVCDSEYGEVDTTNHDSSVECVNGFCPYCDAYEPAVLNGDVYEISNAGQLYWFADQVNNDNANFGSANAILTTDIVDNQNVLDANGDLNGTADSFRHWTPIGFSEYTEYGSETTPYSGIFNGNGKTISGLYIPDYENNNIHGNAFIGQNYGTVKNLGLLDSYIISNDSAGGIVGGNSGSIFDCYNTATVRGDNQVGGICASSIGTIRDCYNSGKILGAYTVGGVVGQIANAATVENCYNTGIVGGSVGYFRVGGIVGGMFSWDETEHPTIRNCYNTGNVTGTEEAGGVLGHCASGIVTNCYNIGNVSATIAIGGVAGSINNATITKCYYLSDFEIDDLDGTAAKTAEQFKSGEVAYLLGRPFGQNIGTNSVPVLYGETVYYGYTSCGDTVAKYTNDETISAEKPDHTQKPTFTVNGDGTHSAFYSCCGTTVTEDHTLTYTASGNIITESCSENCGYSASLTLKAPANLVYDRTEKAATVEGEIIADYELTYSADAVIMAGDYTATLTVGDYSVSLAFTIAKADPDVVTPSDLKATYGQTLADVELPGGWAWKNSSASVGSVGSNTFAAIYTPANISNFNTLERDLTVVVAKAMPTVTAPVAADDLVYNGTARTLITAGTATGGIMQYSLDGSIWSETIPTGKDAKTYTVYYKVVGDGNHNDADGGSVSVTIAPKVITNPVIEGIDAQYLHTGSAITPVPTAVKDGNTVIDPSEYTLTYENNINEGTATLKIVDAANGNYTVSGSKTFQIVVHAHVWNYSASGNTITATCNGNFGTCPDAEQSFTLNAPDVGYSGNPVEAEVTRDGTDLTFTLHYTGTNYDSADAPTSAGDYTVTMTVGDKSVSDTFTISPKDISKVASCQFSLTQTSFVYSGKAPVLNVTGVDSSVGSYTMQEGTDYTVGIVQVNAGSHKLTVTGIGNYTGTVKLDYTITAKEVSIIGAAIQSVTYDPNGYTLTVTGVTFDGVVDGENLAYTAEAILGNTNAFGEQDATVTVTLNNSNYNLATATYQTKVTINKAAATVTAAPTPNDLTYTGVAQNLINGGEATGGEMQYSTNNQTWSTTIPKGTAAGDYTVYYKVVGDANHSDTAVDSVEVTIAKADPVIGTVGCEMALFDSIAASAVELKRTDMTVDGTLILTDAKLTAGEGTYNWKFTPEDTDNYNTITGTVVLTVTADVLEQIRATGTLEKFSYVYGEPFSIDGMTITASYTSGTTKDVTGLVSFDSTLAVGQTAVELTYQGKICVIDGITVARKQLDVSGMAWDVPENAVYSGTAYTATLTSDLPEGVTVIKTGDTATNAGGYTAKAVFSLAEGYSADNYEIVNGADLTAEWSINKAALTITADSYESVRYGSAAPAFAANYSGFVNGETEAVLGGELVFSCEYDTANAAKRKPGDYPIVPSGLTSNNYEISYVDGNLEVISANLVIVIDDKTVTYGDAAPEYTYHYEGFVYGEDISVMDEPGTVSCAYVPGNAVGTMEIKSDNYGSDDCYFVVNQRIGTLTVEKAPLTITAEDNSITYGDAPAANGVTGTGFVNGESFDDLSGELTYSYNYEQFGNVGTYKITPVGLTSDNYEITFADGTLTVNAKAITVTADVVSKIYGDTDPTLTYTAQGLVNGDELTGELKRAAGENVGSYAIEQNTLTAGNNYSITYTGANLTINAKAITEADVELNGSLTYTGEEQTQPITVTEGITYEVTGNKATNVGSYVLTVKGTGNYTGEVKLNWSIKETAAVVTKAPAAKTLTYTGETQELITAGEAEGGTMQYQLNGGAWSASIPTAKDEGTYTVSWKVVGDANHADTEVKSITVTIGDCTHSGNTNKDDADCTTQVTCSVCGDVLVESKAHVWGDWTTTLEPTTTTEGSKERLCTNDGCEEKDTDSIPMLNEVEVPEEIVGGDVSVDNPTPATGDDVTITVTPDTGKEVDEVIVTGKDGKEIPVTDNGDGTYTYEQPDGDVTVEVIIKDTIYTVTWIVDGTTYKTTQYKYGETITAPTDPTKAQSGCTTYTFDKWNGFTSGMTMPDNESLTFTAVFTEGESHIDENTDHICDRNCGKTDMGKHADGNLDHVCEYGCDVAIGEHKDANKDHACDYGCTESIGTCEDADKDHDCDYGCDKIYGEHTDADKNHICDYGCTESIGTCEDADKDHDCDYGCDKVYGEHKDTAGDGDHVCDYGCGETLTDCVDVDTDTDHKCDECGAAIPKDGTQVEIPADDTGTITPGAPAEIDGKPIVIDWDGEIWLEDKDSQLLVTYKFNEDADPHKEYPTAMYAWLLKWEGETCKAIRVPELDNFMTYKGTSIRINHSSDGIRFFTAVPVDTLNQAMKGTLLTGELEGYKLVEMGTLYKWAATGTELTVANGAKSYVYGGSAGSTYRQFSKEGSLSWFTGMLTDLPGDAATLAKDILSRPYAVFENADGDQITLYGGSVQRSIYYVALQNKDTWASGTAYDNYVEKIISTVEAAKG